MSNQVPSFRPGWRGAPALVRGAFRALLGGQMLGQFGDGLAQISFAQLVVFDIGNGATPGRVASVLAATLLPFSIVGPFAGVFIDRWDRRRTLIVASAFRAVLATAAIAAAIVRTEPGAYAGVLLLLSSSRFVLDAKGSALPRTVPTEDLVRANAISGLAGVGAAFLGAVGGAAIVGRWVAAGFVCAAVAYGLAALAFQRLPDVGGRTQSGHVLSATRKVVHELVGGLTAIARTRDLRRPLAAVATHRLLLGAGFVLLILVADHRYHLSTSGYALALGVTGVSAFAGTVSAPWLAGHWPAVVLVPVTFVLPGAALAVAGYSPTLVGLMAAVGVTAVAFQVLKVTSDAVIGAASPDEIRGRTFAVYDVLYNVSFVLAGLAMVPLWQFGKERHLLWWLGCAFGAGWLVTARVARTWPFVSPAVVRPRAASVWPARGGSLIAGALLVVVFPAPSWWWASWALLAPWLLLIRRSPTTREAALRGWWGAAGFLFAAHYWLLPSTTVFLVVIVGALAMLWMPWACLVHWVLRDGLSARRALLATVLVPSGWVLIETVRSWSALGGPWGLIGASQWKVPRMLAPASLGGVWLVSFLVVAANVGILVLIESRVVGARAMGALTLAVALAFGPVWFGLQSRPQVGSSGRATLRVAIVEAGVVHDPSQRLAEELAATGALEPARHDLIVWGESSVGFDLSARQDIDDQLTSLAARTQADVMVNVDAAGAGGAIRKMSVLLDANGTVGTYQKIRLVPFGEYIPVRWALGWLSSITESASVNRVRGTQLSVLDVGGTKVAPLICFENAFPDLAREVTRRGAEVLVYQVATTTFQGTWASRQHASLDAVRSVETGRPSVQAALAGTSAAFDAEGRELLWWPHDRGVVSVDLPLATRSTPYVRYGDWVPLWSLVAVVATIVFASLRGTANTTPEPPD